MRRLTLLTVIGSLWLLSSSPAWSAPQGTGAPSIRIVSPANNATVVGSTVTVHVAVSNFKLVKPQIVGPNHWKQIPLLKGNQGHIHYVLDGMANLVLTRDVVVKETHTWTNVSPGRHTITAYLATSQHAQFPGTEPAIIHVTVKPAAQKRLVSAHSPSIAITDHQVRQTDKGTAVSIKVQVSNFKLLAPVYKNPPVLPPTEGHIHYALDTMMNFIATRNASASLSHPWSNVSPGRHKIIVYLATSQHQLVPGTRPAQITINVPRGKGPGGKTTLYVGNLPKTGGSSAVGFASGRTQFVWAVGLVTVLLLLLGAVTRRRPAA